MSTLGQRLRELREARDMSQRALAEAVKLAPGTIANYETGIRQPDLQTAEMLADYFGVSLDYLLGRSDSPRIYSTDEVQRIMRDAGAIMSFFRAEGATEEDIRHFLQILEDRKRAAANRREYATRVRHELQVEVAQHSAEYGTAERREEQDTEQR